MGALDDPAAGLKASAPGYQLCLLAARSNMGREPERTGQRSNLGVVISLVETKMLRSTNTGTRPSHSNASNRFTQQLEIADVGPRRDQPHRNPGALDQHAALRAGLAPIRGISACFSPRPVEPWSSHHPCSTTSSPAPSARHRLQARFAKAWRRRPRQPMPENGDEPSSSSRCPSRSRHSIGTPSAPRTEWHPSHRDHCDEADHRRNGVCSCVWVTTAPQTPTNHPTYANDSLIDSSTSMHLPFRPSMPRNTIDKSMVIGIGSKQILHNPIYIGVSYRKCWVKKGKTHTFDRYNPDAIWVENAHEPIVDQTLWDAAHKQLESRRVQRQQPAHMLTGILRCPLCGSTYRAESSRTRSGSSKPYYVCQSKRAPVDEFGGRKRQGDACSAKW